MDVRHILRLAYAINIITNTSGQKYTTYLSHAINYMQAYNGLVLHSVILLVTPRNYINDSSFCEDTIDSLHPLNNQMFVNCQIMSQTTINNISYLLRDPSMSTVNVLFGFEQTMLLRNVVKRMSNHYFEKHAWLIVLESEFRNKTDVYQTMLNLTSGLTTKSKITLNSQVYVLASLKMLYTC